MGYSGDIFIDQSQSIAMMQTNVTQLIQVVKTELPSAFQTAGKTITDSMNAANTSMGFVDHLSKAFNTLAGEASLAEKAFALLKVGFAIGPIVQACASAINAASVAIMNMLTSESSLIGIKMISLALQAKEAVVLGIATVAKLAHSAATSLESAALGGNIIAMIAWTVVTVAATAAQWLLNAAMAANPVGLVVVAIAALIAILAALVIATNSGSEAYKAENEYLKELNEEHKNYAKNLEDSKNAALEEGQSKVAQAQVNQGLCNSLAALVDENGKFKCSAEEAKTAVDSLEGNVSGLSLGFDETSNSIKMNGEQLTKYGESLVAVAKYEAAQSEYNNLLKEQGEAQAKINVLEEKKAIYQEKVKSGNMSQGEANRLINEAEKTQNKYAKSIKDTADEVDAAKKAKEKAFNSEAQAEVQAQEIRTNSMDQVEQYARKYGISTDQVISEASKMSGGLQKWSKDAEKTYAPLMAAEQDYINAIKDGSVEIDATYAQNLDARKRNGETLNATDQAYLDQWHSINKKAADTYRAQQQEIVDASKGTKEAIIMDEQQSAAERIAIQEKNNAATRKFTENYNAMYAKIPPEQRKYLAEMDLDDARFLDDMIGKWDKGGKEQWDKYVGNIEEGVAISKEKVQIGGADMVGGQTEAIGQAVEGQKATLQEIFGGVGKYAGMSMEDKLKEATALMGESFTGTAEESMLQQLPRLQEIFGGAGEFAEMSMEERMQAASALLGENFTGSVGESMAEKLPELMAIFSGAGDYAGMSMDQRIAAAGALIAGTCTQMGDQGGQNMVNAMANGDFSLVSNGIAAAVQNGLNMVIGAAGAACEQVAGALQNMYAQIEGTMLRMFVMVTGVFQSMGAILGNQAAGIVQGIMTHFDTLYGKCYWAMNMAMVGMLKAMEDYKHILYKKADEIADNIKATLKKAFEENSPSKATYRIFKYVMLGGLNAMEDYSGKLYQQTENLAEGVLSRMGDVPSAMLDAMTYDMQGAIGMNHSLSGAFVPVMAGGMGGNGVVINQNISQTINSPKHQSAAENSRELHAMLNRANWQIM